MTLISQVTTFLDRGILNGGNKDVRSQFGHDIDQNRLMIQRLLRLETFNLFF